MAIKSPHSADEIHDDLVIHNVNHPDAGLFRMCHWLADQLNAPRSWRLPTLLVVADTGHEASTYHLACCLAGHLWKIENGTAYHTNLEIIGRDQQVDTPRLDPGEPLIVLIEQPRCIAPRTLGDIISWSGTDRTEDHPGRQVLVIINAEPVSDACLEVVQACYWRGELGRQQLTTRLRATICERLPLVRDLLGQHAWVAVIDESVGLDWQAEYPREIMTKQLMEYVSAGQGVAMVPGIGAITSSLMLWQYLLAQFNQDRHALIDHLVRMMTDRNTCGVSTLAAELLAMQANGGEEGSIDRASLTRNESHVMVQT